MTSRLASLQSAIAAQERTLHDADRRLIALGAYVGHRVHALMRPARRAGVGTAVAVAALALWRWRRAPAKMHPAAGTDWLPAALNAGLPLLVPVIGARAAALLGALAAAPAAARSQPAAQAPARAVDLQRFAGTWHEIARRRAPFERPCAGDVTATYLLTPEGIRVVNRCRRRDGRTLVTRGRVRLADPLATSALSVTFAPRLLQWLPIAWADYWILDVDPHYRHALLGTPDRRRFWILARSPSLPEPVLRALVLQAAARGYDVRRLQRS